MSKGARMLDGNPLTFDVNAPGVGPGDFVMDFTGAVPGLSRIVVVAGVRSLVAVGGGGGLPVALAANELAQSTGPGTSYVAVPRATIVQQVLAAILGPTNGDGLVGDGIGGLRTLGLVQIALNNALDAAAARAVLGLSNAIGPNQLLRSVAMAGFPFAAVDATTVITNALGSLVGASQGGLLVGNGLGGVGAVAAVIERLVTAVNGQGARLAIGAEMNIAHMPLAFPASLVTRVGVTITDGGASPIVGALVQMTINVVGGNITDVVPGPLGKLVAAVFANGQMIATVETGIGGQVQIDVTASAAALGDTYGIGLSPGAGSAQFPINFVP